MCPNRKIRPAHLPWPPAITSPRERMSALNGAHSIPSGQPGGGDRRRAVVRGGHEPQPEGLQAGTDRGGDARVAGPGPLAALGAQPLDADAQAVEDGDRRRPWRLALAGPLARLGEVPVDARHRRGLAGGDGPRAERRDRDPRRGHPRLLAGADHEIHAPAVHLERHGAEPADAVDDQQRLAGGAAHDLRELPQRVRDAGRGLVVGDQDGAVRIAAVQVHAERGRRRPTCPTRPRSDRHRPRRRAAIFANRSPKAPIVTTSTRSPGRQRVHDGGFHRAGAGAGEQQDLARGRR